MRVTQAIPAGIALFLATAGYAAAAPANTPDKPRLILAIVVDQFREDYTTRFRGEYTAGIANLLENGAVFPDAHQQCSRCMPLNIRHCKVWFWPSAKSFSTSLGPAFFFRWD